MCLKMQNNFILYIYILDCVLFVLIVPSMYFIDVGVSPPIPWGALQIIYVGLSDLTVNQKWSYGDDSWSKPGEYIALTSQNQKWSW